MDCISHLNAVTPCLGADAIAVDEDERPRH